MTSKVISNLENLFKHSSTVTLQPSMKFYRGCWLGVESFPGGYWFAPTLDGAAQYIAMHAETGRQNGRTPYIFECNFKHPITFFELKQSHITSFEAVYSGNWSHEQIANDIPIALSNLQGSNIAGFYLPNTKEYFICDPKNIFTQSNIWKGVDALKEASRVKGFDV